MLRWRLILGTLLVAALVALCWLEHQLTIPGILLLPLALVCSALGASELIAMFRARGHEPLDHIVYVGSLLTIIVASAPALPLAVGHYLNVGAVGLFATVFAASLLFAVLAEMRRYDGTGKATTNLALTMLAILYVGGLLAFLVQLRLLGDKPWTGLFALVSLIAVVKMSDIGQYAVGRLIGRQKLAPKLSPGKTWEGLFGGFVFAGLTAWLLVERQAYPATWFSGPHFLHGVVYGMALASAGVVGDLTESMFKRDAGCKDSSAWMPGFGGVLDLLDSLLGAAPVGYLFWVLGYFG
jgi:phosphatidate cytidylyltransferase